VTTHKKLSAFRIDPEILTGLRRVKERDGIPISEQVRRALLHWLKTKAVTVKRSHGRAGSS